jgi:hypothetical protein
METCRRLRPTSGDEIGAHRGADFRALYSWNQRRRNGGCHHVNPDMQAALGRIATLAVAAAPLDALAIPL